MDNTNHDKESGQSFLLLKRIREGSLEPSTLKKEERQGLVEIVWLEGYTITHMAGLFKTCEKTIRRDLDDIKNKLALAPSADFAKKIIGETVHKANSHWSSIIRVARSSNATAQEKIQGEFMAWRVLRELLEKLQSLGYLPSRPAAIVGDIFHHVDEADMNSVIEGMDKQLFELEGMLAGKDKIPEPMKKDFLEVKGFIEDAKKSKNKPQKEENKNEKAN